MSNLFRGEITNGVAEFNFGEELKGEFPTTVFLNGVVDQTFFGEEHPDGGVLNPIDHGNVGDKVTFVIGNKVKTLNKINSGGGVFDSDITIPAGIPDSVENIGSSAFLDCSFFSGSLTIPDSVKIIGAESFKGCFGFTGSLTIPDSVTTIGDFAFNGCSGFTGSLTIPDSVTTIGQFAFASCNFTGSLTIPEGVTTIRGYTFYQCNFTGSLIIPEGVTTIETDAFFNCTGFTGSLTIPNSVTSIGDYAFNGMFGINGPLTLPSILPLELGLAAFAGTPLNGALSLTGNISKIGRSAFNNTDITSLNIDSNFDISAVLGYASFRNMEICTSINVDVANTTLKSINGILFSADESILIRYPEGKTNTSYTIPNSVTTIDAGAFNADSVGGGPTITALPTSLNIIGNDAFEKSSLTVNNLVLPNTVTSIGEGAFYNCHSLTGLVTIPNSVTSIGNFAFLRNLNITGVNCYIDKSIIDAAAAVFQFSAENTAFTIHARSSDASWTAGSGQTIGGRLSTVIKDLPG